MRSLTIPDEMFERLAKRAAALNVSIEQLLRPLLELAAGNGGEATPAAAVALASFDDWKKMFDDWMASVEARASRYPPGFVMDDSRESVYEGCGE